MRPSTWRLDDLRTVILNLGYVGENLHTRIIIDCKKMFDQYPNASVSMTVTPPEGEPYPGLIERDGDLVIWDVRDCDLVAEGDGEIQLVFTQEPHIARSYNARTHVCRSQVPTGDVPSGLDDFVTRANQLLDQVEDTFPAGGTTGQVLAKKSDTDYNTEWVDQGGGTEDYDELENRPQIGGVTLTGNKTLHDLGAASEADVAAKYTKPETGIPASDLAAGVIPVLTDLIDDTAGSGDTDKVWSADKSHELLTEINSKQDAPSATGTAGKVLGLDSNINPMWMGLTDLGLEQTVFAKTANNVVDWEQGTFNNDTGVGSSSSNAIRTKDKIGTENSSVTCASGYEMNVLAWDEKGDYIGVWNKNSSTFVKSGVAWYDSVDLHAIANGHRYKYKITVRKSPLASIGPSEANNITILTSRIEGIEIKCEELETETHEMLIPSRTANNVTTWEQGTFSNSTGGLSSSSNAIRTKDRIGTEHSSVTCASGYEMNILAWDEEGTYLGAWNKGNNTFVKGGISWYDSANLQTIANGNKYTFHITVRKSVTGTIEPSAASNVTIVTSVIDGIKNKEYESNKCIYSNVNGSDIGFMVGSYKGDTGAMLTQWNNIRSFDFLPDGVSKIVTTDSYVFYLFAWSKSTGEYVGCWNNGSFEWTSSVSNWYSVIDLKYIGASNYKLKIAVKKSNDASFVMSDALSKITFTIDDIKKQGELVAKLDNTNSVVYQSDDIVFARTTSKSEEETGYIPPLTLLHFSDIHNDTINYPFIRQFYKEHREISDIINTGDFVGLTYNSAQISAYFSVFDNDNYALLAIGNHEYYYEENYPTKMPSTDVYTYYMAPTIESWGVTYTSGKNYWYKDYTDEKVRLIGIDCMLADDEMSAQVAWITSVLADAKENDLAVVIAGHCPPTNVVGTKIASSFTVTETFPYDNDMNALNENGAGIMAAVDTFQTNGGEFVCYLMGHWHLDMLMYSSTYPNQLIVDIGPARHYVGPTMLLDNYIRRDEGTRYQHMFNVVTVNRTDGLLRLVRIGANRDITGRPRNTLCYNYKTHTLIYSD